MQMQRFIEIFERLEKIYSWIFSLVPTVSVGMPLPRHIAFSKKLQK
jgi:hypothetical protein